MPNLFIAYDLTEPDRNYTQVRAAIEGLGRYGWLQYSLAYVKTDMSADECWRIVADHMGPRDRLLVIVSTYATGNLPNGLEAAINGVWFT